jgi:SOS-response transcriptional repressor LexA
MNAGDRIAAERASQNMSQQELSDRVNRLGGKISQTGIDKMEKRGSERPRYIREIAIALNVSQEWLLTGKGSKHKQSAATELSIAELSIISWVSAGDISKADISDVEIGRIALSGLDANGDWVALQVQGDSMDRISPPGSIVVVNRKDKRLVANACYVIADDDGSATYKRYRPSPARFEPVSTNPDHEPIYPDNDPQIIGRVRRTILEM